MESETRSMLIKTTAEFYAFHADSFDASRQSAWDSWDYVLKIVHEHGAPKTVLDLGCGNGRFAGFLVENGIADVEYLGIDTSEQLIEKAKHRYPNFTFQVDDIESALTITEPFDLVVSFGVFHHIPGTEYRQRLLQQIASLVSPGGLAVISFWQPKLTKNFDQKISTNHGIVDLEENDFLLGWKGDFSHLRYIHHFNEVEIDELISDSSLKLIDRFQSSGNDAANQLLILQHAHVMN